MANAERKCIGGIMVVPIFASVHPCSSRNAMIQLTDSGTLGKFWDSRV
jgi:hypothetical protein